MSNFILNLFFIIIIIIINVVTQLYIVYYQLCCSIFLQKLWPIFQDYFIIKKDQTQHLFEIEIFWKSIFWKKTMIFIRTILLVLFKNVYIYIYIYI